MEMPRLCGWTEHPQYREWHPVEFYGSVLIGVCLLGTIGVLVRVTILVM